MNPFHRAAPPETPASKLPPPEQALIFATIAALLAGLFLLQRRAPGASAGHWLPRDDGAGKRTYEAWVLAYSVVWMGSFAVIIALQLYEAFDAAAYFVVCGSLALPLWVQALRAAAAHGGRAAHALRAQLWVAVFGFIGNYWYTHYFYSVLRARYTMPSWRLNDVPVAMYLATHFYFSSYHVFANLVLRKVRTRYAPGAARDLLFVGLVISMSYAVAFMETLTISHFPYYDFEDRALAYTVGSAFYGIYFVVSFPVYFALDEATWATSLAPGRSLVEVAISSLGAGMTARSTCPPWQRPGSPPVPPQGAPGGSVQLGTLRGRPSHRASGHGLSCSSEPPPKAPISLSPKAPISLSPKAPISPRVDFVGMLVLLMLDLVRLGVVGAPLTIGGKLFEVTG